MVADGGPESERPDEDDDQQDASGQDDSASDGSQASSSDGSLPSNADTRTCKLSPELGSGDLGGLSDTAGRARGAPRGAGESGVGA